MYAMWWIDGKRGLNPFKPEFTIVIFVHYKPRIAVAILDFSTGWRWLEVDGKFKKIAAYWKNSFVLKPSVVGKLGLFAGM